MSTASCSEERKISLNDGHDNRLPRLPVNPRAHPFAIGVAVGTTLLGSGIIPLVLYFALTRATTWPLSTILAIPASIFGLVSLLSLCARTYALAKPSSTCRPLRRSSSNGSAWTLDYYGWNFLLGFVGVSAVITAGLSVAVLPSVRMVATSLPVLMMQVCGQLVLLASMRACGVEKAPWRLSSVGKGEALVPATYVIAEDVLAVDAKQGQLFRAAWKARYEYSVPFGELLARLDWTWGVTGLAVAGGVLGVIWGVEEEEIGWAVGMSDSILLCGQVLADILHLQLGRYHGYGRV
ncbi:MAG: hypothetical protein LQ344_006541 [Seirophora lacunosa]|nr:MAG: hypothetical protein LQ344_006541 [Seirophora lacunosa]